MITKNYIKMCEQAEEEIQREWRQENGDFVFWKVTESIKIITDHFFAESFKDFVWLPTLGQLFEIWCYLCGTNNFAGICQRMVECKRSKIVTYPNIRYIKELCLEIIMKEFYNKIWTGEKWVKYE